MKQVLYAALAGALFVLMGIGINQYALWSGLTNYSIPWLCSAIGISVGLLGIHQFASEKKLKMMGHWFIWGVVVVIACIGVVVDGFAYTSGAGAMNVWLNLLEVAGFGVIYFALLFFLF